MKHYITLIIAAITIAMASSCASQRALTGDVQGISAKLDARISAFKLDENANGTIKMKRGEAIQISLTKFGIEGARVIFTPDSILYVSKLTKTYLRTSFREADKALGGEGTLTFRNVEAYFWNDNNQSSNYATLPIAGIVPVELRTSYGRNLRAGQYQVPQKINIRMSDTERVIEPGEVKLKLSKVTTANNWQPNTEISSKYKSLNIISLVKNLLKK